MPFSPSGSDRDAALRFLQALADHPHEEFDDPRILGLLFKITKQRKHLKRQALRDEQRSFDRSLLNETVLVQKEPLDLQAPSLGLILPDVPEAWRPLQKAIPCYACKTSFTEIHFHYHRLCPTCAEDNYKRREAQVDLSGRIALITGGRIKIGFQTALRLLRAGARVLVTTRFPKDALRRYALEPDFPAFRERLSLIGLDLRSLPEVERFAAHLRQTEPFLDILIHNAAQTIQRPLAFFAHLFEEEAQPLEGLPSFVRGCLREAAFPAIAEEPFLVLPSLPPPLAQASGTTPSSKVIHAPGTTDAPGATDATHVTSTHAGDSLPERTPEGSSRPAITALSFPQDPMFPSGLFDIYEQQVDLRDSTSWVKPFEEIETPELLEVHLINAFAPFLLNRALKPLLLLSPHPRRFIVHVTAMEGQFSRTSKPASHPHTNMAKAALNMLTRTSAEPLTKEGIYMTSVDPGWSSQENPFPKRQRMREAGFVAPLDLVDSAARLLHPIIEGLDPKKTPWFGIYLKDYKPFPW